jgi:hypothetical protein
VDNKVITSIAEQANLFSVKSYLIEPLNVSISETEIFRGALFYMSVY